MIEDNLERKIAVILVADVVGYSKHMEKEESATLSAYSECEKIINELLEQKNGSIFNTAGDSILAEFTSAVNAVEFAVEFQKKIDDRNRIENNSVKLEFRIGINMGDVISKKGNLLGDGVNIAARLEALSQPNGVCISKNIYDLVAAKTELAFNDLGVQKVKQNEFHAYDILLTPSQKRKISQKTNQSRLKITLTLFATILIICGLIYQTQFSSINTQTAESKNFANKPIVFVRPILSVGEIEKSTSLALTESLISNLSQYNGITSLSSSTSFAAEKKGFSDTQLKDELNVNYSISGSIQSFGSNTRLYLELTDLKAQEVIWSHKEDFRLENMFDVQDKIGREILEKLQISAVVGSGANTWQKDFKTFDQFLLAINARGEWRKWTKEGLSNAIDITSKLAELEIDRYVLADLTMWNLHQKVILGLSEQPEIDRSEILKLTNMLVSERGRDLDYRARAVFELEHFGKDCSRAAELISKIKDMSANADNFLVSGFVNNRCKNFAKSAESFRQALLLEPMDQGYQITRLYTAILYTLNRYDELKSLIEPKLPDPELGGMTFWFYAGVLAEEGNLQKAQEYYELGVRYGATENFLMHMLNTEEAEGRLLNNLATFMDK